MQVCAIWEEMYLHSVALVSTLAHLTAVYSSRLIRSMKPLKEVSGRGTDYHSINSNNSNNEHEQSELSWEHLFLWWWWAGLITHCKSISIHQPAQRKTFSEPGTALIQSWSWAVIGKLNWGDGILLIELAAGEKRTASLGQCHRVTLREWGKWRWWATRSGQINGNTQRRKEHDSVKSSWRGEDTWTRALFNDWMTYI